MRILVHEELGNTLNGRVNGRRAFAKLCERLAGVAPGTVVELDFSQVQYVSASWINAAVVSLLLFGAEEKNDLYFVVRNFPKDSLDDLRFVAEELHVPVVVAAANGTGDIYGHLDIIQRETLETVQSHGEVTGAMLASANITGPAWNNRLRDLNQKRLLRRRKNGREQIYFPVVKELTFHG